MHSYLNEWAEALGKVSLTAWEDLPKMELYSEQTIQYIRELLWFIDSEDEPIITKAMINNYVKNEIIPKPIKKKYTKVHLAHLIAISMLKQVLSIPQIKAGIEYQSKISGAKEAYNLFCEEINLALQNLMFQIKEEDTRLDIKEYTQGRKAMRFAANAFAYKLIATKTVELRLFINEEEKNS